ncbi:MAG: SRPBCC domain-containing protein [Ardenticatenales bacterium]|nr:SRPBCC domain-containing protein [Ardenticatenales bacterium]
MNNSFSAAAAGRATTTRRFFSRETTVSILIAAAPATVWALLTDAAGYSRWNSTVTSLQGEIVPGGQLALKSILDEKRVFKLRVKEFVPEKRLVWGDSQGSRVYELVPAGPGQTRFTMTEKIGGPFFPLFARFIPPFDEVFSQFAADLKQAAEAAV